MPTLLLLRMLHLSLLPAVFFFLTVCDCHTEQKAIYLLTYLRTYLKI